MISIEADGVEEAARSASTVLEAGSVVAYPTETVYGLGVDVSDEEALNKLYTLKERPLSKAVSIMLADSDMLVGYFPRLPVNARALAEAFLPGPLTLVLETLPEFSTHFGDTIGVRIPDDVFCQRLVKTFGSPVTTTSANKSGSEPATTAREVLDYFADGIDLLVDGGKSPGGTASTVVDAVSEKPVILRRGAVTRESIMEVLKNID